MQSRGGKAFITYWNIITVNLSCRPRPFGGMVEYSGLVLVVLSLPFVCLPHRYCVELTLHTPSIQRLVYQRVPYSATAASTIRAVACMASLPLTYPYRSLNPLKLSISMRQNARGIDALSLFLRTFSIASPPGRRVRELVSKYISSRVFSLLVISLKARASFPSSS